MDVTVSIVNHSARDALVALLDSLAAELDGPLDVEAVVLDNASDDGSLDAVRERFPWARVIAQTHRAGFGANHNRVIRETSGRYVYLLSPDARVEPGSLVRLGAYMDTNPRVGAVAPRLRYPDGRAQPSAWRFPTPTTALLGTFTLSRLGVVQSGGADPRRVDWAMGAALLLRRAALDDVGLFDEGFFLYSEETDLCLRLAQAGWETHFLPAVTVVHAASSLRGEFARERIAEEWRSRHRYWRKHQSPAGARLAALATGAQYAARAGVAGALVRLGSRRFDASFPERMREHARRAFGRADGPGLRELAERWNEKHAPQSRPSVRESIAR
jgi:N-acetylglucosaminyl-diphospho-decaprenol L-rhamnosyltransferase